MELVEMEQELVESISSFLEDNKAKDAKAVDLDGWPETDAAETWEVDGCALSVVRTPAGHFCGYVRFPDRPAKGGDYGYDGILTYVPVHGGLTYCREDLDGSVVYGFDCAHVGDEANPDCYDLTWLRRECERMLVGILVAAKLEEQYLAVDEPEARAEIIDCYHDHLRTAEGIDFNLQSNFGAMINVIFGGL